MMNYRRRMYHVCSDQLPREVANGEPHESQVSDDIQHASDILQFSRESTPLRKSDSASEMNGSGKWFKKGKRTQWFNVRVLLFSLYVVIAVYVLAFWSIDNIGQICCSFAFQ